MLTPYPTNEQRNDQLVYEAFLRRAARLELPFMLKGSYVTRQYLADPADRRPGDLDWLYLDHLPDVATAQRVFNEWATAVTEQDLGDGVRFRSFRENAFWRSIDYAMDDDFPTVNTDLGYWLGDGELRELSLDVSFNLPLAAPSVPLRYQPLQGESFVVPHSAPLALQIAWKLHQTLVRPRFKDLFDLVQLLPLVRPMRSSPDVRPHIMQALLAECRADNVDPSPLHYVVEGRLEWLFQAPGAQATWDYWRHGTRGPSQHHFYIEAAEAIINLRRLPDTLAEFAAQVRLAFEDANFAEMLVTLPRPSGVTTALSQAAPVQTTPSHPLDKTAATQAPPVQTTPSHSVDKTVEQPWNLLVRIKRWLK